MHRSFGWSLIGMTAATEAKLAREAELVYSQVAMVTDYDCWHPNHDDVTVDQIIAVVTANAEKARTLVRASVPRLAADADRQNCSCQSVLTHALITAPEVRDPALMKKLDAVAGRVLRK